MQFSTFSGHSFNSVDIQPIDVFTIDDLSCITPGTPVLDKQGVKYLVSAIKPINDSLVRVSLIPETPTVPEIQEDSETAEVPETQEA